jgi:CRP-like cAMP-binding protein
MSISNHPEFTTMATLAGNRQPRQAKAGEVLFRIGDKGSTMYGVVSGEIELNWGEDHIEVLGAGSCFGAGALADLEHRRFATATALSNSDLLELNREQFLFAMQELPMFALEMLHDLELRLQAIQHADTKE